MIRADYCIVGSGIAGIYAALWIKTQRPKANVVVIEQASTFGGLLASKKHHGYAFDYGTHIPRETGDSEIDSLLFGHLDPLRWRRFNNINAGSVALEQKLYTHSAAPCLPENSDFNWLESIPQSHHKSSYPHLKAQLLHEFGNRIVEQFLAPCLERTFGVALEELASNSHQLIGLKRLILGDEALMREAKKVPRLDAILSYADQSEGMSNKQNYYPSDGSGIGLWTDSLLKQAVKLGVLLFSNVNIQSVRQDNRNIESLLIDSKAFGIQMLQVEQLIWTAPSFILHHLCKLPAVSAYRPMIRKTELYHLAFAHPFTTQNTYIQIFDPDLNSFRVTLYPNLSTQKQPLSSCTVEVILPQTTEPPEASVIVEELQRCGIVSPNNPCVFCETDTVRSGFPVMTNEFFATSLAYANSLEETFDNVMLLGKGSGKFFFMEDILKDAHRQLSITQSAKKSLAI